MSVSSASSCAAAESSSASMLAAAHSVYLQSERREADWADFVDTAAHAMATLGHNFGEGREPQLSAGAITELPRAGMTAAESAAAAAAAGGLAGRAGASGQMAALLHELQHTQCYRNAHNVGAAAAVRAGASVGGGGPVTDLRLLSATCFRSLADLCAAADPTLDAIFSQYRDGGGAHSAAAYAELLHSLLTLGTRWRRYVFYREDPSGFVAQSRALFGVLDDFVQRGLITVGECDFVENMLYSLRQNEETEAEIDEATESESQFLLAAWSLCWEALAPDSGAGPGDQAAAVAEFYDSILHLLERQVKLIFTRYAGEATAFLHNLNRSHNYAFPPAALKHLHALIQHQAVLDERKRAGVTEPLTPREELLQSQSTVLLACFAESAQTQNANELVESLLTVGAGWAKSSPHKSLLQCLHYMASQDLLSRGEMHLLELLVYEEDSTVLDAWERYEGEDYTKPAFDLLLEEMHAALEGQFQREMAALTCRGYALVNAWSVAPDAAPLLHQDPLRNQVLGLPAVRLAPAAPEFPLPAQARCTLGAGYSEVVRSLLARRDPVLLALLAEHAENGDAAELLDGVARLLRREMAGSSAAASSSSASAPSPSSSSSSAQAAAAAAAAAPVSGQALDVYQLSQMLLSLHRDGYLDPATLQNLLRAVQGQDAVLLAAFALYKEGLARDGNGTGPNRGWPDLWETINLVARRIERQSGPQAAAEEEQGEEEEEEEEGQQSRQACAETPASYLSPSEAASLRHLGTRLIDALSGGQDISITNTLYLRDLLRRGDETIFAIMSLLADGTHTEGETVESLARLSERWLHELSAEEQALVDLLVSLCTRAKAYSPAALDYLLGLVYARDTTLSAAYSLFREAAAREEVCTDSDEADDSDDEGEEEEEDDSDDEDDFDDSEEYSEQDEEDEEDEEEEEEERNEQKYNGDFARSAHRSAPARSAGRSRVAAGASAVRGHHRRSSTGTYSRSLAELVDSISHILRVGNRTIAELNGGAMPGQRRG